MSSLDLNLLPFVRQNGQDASNLPGLYMVTPPHQTARGRSLDQLILFFNMAGNAPLTDQQQEQLLGRLAQTYYKTPGSITAALKIIMDAMNQFLLDRNLRSSSSGKQCIGLMSLLVLRETNMLLAQSGPVHTFFVTQQDSQEFYDPQGAGRGLGLTRAVSIRFYQFELHPNDLLLLSPQPAPAWNTSALQAAPGQGLETMRRRLLSQAGPEITAVIIQVQPGTGKLRLLRTKAPLQMAQPPAQTDLPVEATPPEANTASQSEIPSTPEPVPPVEVRPQPSVSDSPTISDSAPYPQTTPPVSDAQAAEPAEAIQKPLEGQQASEVKPPEAQPPDVKQPELKPPGVVLATSTAADLQISPAASHPRNSRLTGSTSRSIHCSAGECLDQTSNQPADRSSRRSCRLLSIAQAGHISFWRAQEGGSGENPTSRPFPAKSSWHSGGESPGPHRSSR